MKFNSSWRPGNPLFWALVTQAINEAANMDEAIGILMSLCIENDLPVPLRYTAQLKIQWGLENFHLAFGKQPAEN